LHHAITTDHLTKIFVGCEHLHLINPRIVEAGSDNPSLPLMARIAARRGFGVFVADIVPIQ
jgi:hypothetical protein